MSNKPSYAAVASNEPTANPKAGKSDAPQDAPPPCKSLTKQFPYCPLTHRALRSHHNQNLFHAHQLGTQSPSLSPVEEDSNRASDRLLVIMVRG